MRWAIVHWYERRTFLRADSKLKSAAKQSHCRFLPPTTAFLWALRRCWSLFASVFALLFRRKRICFSFLWPMQKWPFEPRPRLCRKRVRNGEGRLRVWGKGEFARTLPNAYFLCSILLFFWRVWSNWGIAEILRGNRQFLMTIFYDGLFLIPLSM